eukprot:gnl/TRDRNA2_/TRDRNA2_134231_c0_seq3.p1 gnl/TRDRNA2_/TRDRNA2_134231_c0~~gnl/TRDRNA2_/TRDRNA2_134231_c0_seq3.p1  ORF type:complete len:264 (+),score=47.66 gnl/TRDRNA2_/TRDRNA2_134231_c0_seq3:56-847(+)
MSRARAGSASGGAGAAQPPQLSTTGGPFDEDEAGKSKRDCLVVLSRVRDQGIKGLPAEVRLDAGSQSVVTVGRSEDNDIVLAETKAASKVHCHIAMRTFKLLGQTQAHQAVFLHDVSRNKTLVNGNAAVRPWQWLHDGDVIGLHTDSNEPSLVADLFKVKYRKLIKLPAAQAKGMDGMLGPDHGKPVAAAPSRKRGRTASASASARSSEQMVDYWLGCEECSAWHKVSKAVHDKWEPKRFVCANIDMVCKPSRNKKARTGSTR